MASLGFPPIFHLKSPESTTFRLRTRPSLELTGHLTWCAGAWTWRDAANAEAPAVPGQKDSCQWHRPQMDTYYAYIYVNRRFYPICVPLVGIELSSSRTRQWTHSFGMKVVFSRTCSGSILSQRGSNCDPLVTES